MKKIVLSFICGAMAAVCLIGCSKVNDVVVEPSSDDNEVVLWVDDFNVSVDTKVTAVTSVPSSLYWCSTTGTLGDTSEKAAWVEKTTTSVSVTSNKINTGHYQTASPTSYNYYVSSAAITAPASGTAGSITISVPDNTKDIVCGKTGGNNTTAPSVALGHIFARTGTLTMNTQSGYTISGVSWKISGGGTKGTYNITSGAWNVDSSSKLTNTALTSSSDLYLAPGSYTISCTYTLAKGEYSKQFTKSATVTLEAGKINNITGTASGGNASEIVLSVTVTDWVSKTLEPTFS